MMIRIAAYQGTPAFEWGNRKTQIHTILQQADAQRINFICFPEGFLTGYYDTAQLMRENSFSISDPTFCQFLQELSLYNIAIIIGFNEKDGDNLYDSAAIIHQGKLIGVQRKHFKYHEFCASGSEYKVFTVNGVTFGVVICLDSNYFEPARICALQGATILFVPACNKVSINHKFAQRPPYYSHFVARSHENRCWLISADWIWSNDGHVVCPGHSAIYDPDGKEIMRSKEGVEDLLVVDIPCDQLFVQKGMRVVGSATLLTYRNSS